jgi:hypothetical protein
MARIFSAVSFVAILVLGGLAHVRQEIPQKLPSNPLERQVPYSDLDLLTTRNAFQGALGLARVPAGVATVFGCQEDPPQQLFRGVGQKVSDVMDQLVSMDPKYRWEMDDGVINLLPVAGEPALLRTQIPAFDADDITSAWAVVGKIEQAQEVRKAMGDMELSWGLKVFSTLFSPNPKKFSVHFKGGSVREALNAAARAEGSAIWDYTEKHCNGKNEVVISF